MTKVRVRKSGEAQPKANVLVVENKDGSTSYRCPCDECGKIDQVPFLPKQGRDFLCRQCLNMRDAKPGTESFEKRGETWYKAPCDACGNLQMAPFAPKRNRTFLCNACRLPPKIKRTDGSAPRSFKPVKKGIQSIGSPDDPAYLVPCDKCRAKVEVKFVPGPKSNFLCPKCYGKQSNKSQDTRALFMLDCPGCGKQVMLDFVPRHGDNSLCNTCFEKQKRRP